MGPTVKLSEPRVFRCIPGLWKGEKAPFVRASVLRGTNFSPDGSLDLTDVPILEVEERQFARRVLEQGDIIVERSGGGPKQPVGRVAFFDRPNMHPFCTSNFTTAIRVVDQNIFLPQFVHYFLLHLYLCGYTIPLQRATTGLRNLDFAAYLETDVPKLPLDEQRAVVNVIVRLQRIARLEQQQYDAALRLKESVVDHIFTRGLHSEAQKETEIGLVPTSWLVSELGRFGRVGNGSTPKKTNAAYWTKGSFPWLTSAKVYERLITQADQFVTDLALRECHLPRVKPRSLVIAITGQGKTLGHCALLGIEATISQHLAYVQFHSSDVQPNFVRHYLETRYEHLRQIAQGGGSTKGALTCAFLRSYPIPVPPLDEQSEIVTILDAIDREIDLHKRKRGLLDDLFRSLLHKLMTGEIRVNELSLSENAQ